MAGSKIAGITIEIGGETTKLQSALKGVNRNLGDTKSALKDVDKLLKLDPKNAELLQQKQKLLAAAVQETSEKLKIEKDALEQLKNGPQTEKTIRQQEALTREIADTENQLSSLKKEYENFGSVAKQQAKVAADEIKKVGEKISSVGDTVSGLGKKMTVGVTTPIVAAGTAAVKSAVDFEDAMAKVSTIADTTEIPIGDLRDAIVELSNETGISATDIADNVYNAISAGQKTGDAVNFVAASTKLAKAGFTDSASALDILTTTLNAYGFKADEVTRVSDVLIQTQNLGKTTVGELAAAMGKVIPTAKSNGVELESLAGCYAVMTANGIATAETTTYLNGMLNELGKQGSSAAEALAKGTADIKEGGLTMAECMDRGMSLNDVLGILASQAEKTGTTIQNMFGSAEAGKAANVLYDNSAKLDETIQSMGAAAGSTDEAFAKLDTTSYNTQKTINELKNTGIELGTQVLQMAAPYLEQIMSKVSELCAWLGSLDESQQQMIIKCAGIAAAAGPVLAIGGKAVSGIGSLVQAGSGLIGTVSSIAGKLGGLASGAGSAVEKVSSLGTAAGSASAPVSSAGSAVGTLSQNALGLVAAGAGILLASAGLALLAQSAIQIAGAGPGAAVAMVAMIAALAGMAAGAAALAPALTAGAAGLVAFGAGVTLVGAGVLLATSGVALLATQLPNIAANGAGAAAAIAQIGTSLTALATGAGLTAAAVTAMLIPFAGAAVTIGATDIALAGLAATFTLAAGGAALLDVAILGVSTSVASISADVATAGDALTDMVSSVDIVKTSLNGLGDFAGSAIKKFSQAFTSEQESASASAKAMVGAVMLSLLLSTDAGMLTVEKSWTTSLNRLDTSSRVLMAQVENTMKESINKIVKMFADTKLEFSRDMKLPHFTLNGTFDPQTGSVPKVSVSWYRKAYDDAYLLNGATIFGAMNGKFLGGGEGHGSEMVVGTDKLMQMIRKASGGNQGFTQNLTINAPTELSPSEVARQTRNANRQMVLALKGVR